VFLHDILAAFCPSLIPVEVQSALITFPSLRLRANLNGAVGHRGYRGTAAHNLCLTSAYDKSMSYAEPMRTSAANLCRNLCITKSMGYEDAP